MRRTLTSLLFTLALSFPALAASTVNPNAPAQSSSLSSAVVRSNFAAAYSDINNILGMYAGTAAPVNPINLQYWADTTTSPVYRIKIWNATTLAWITTATLNISTGAYATVSTAGSFAAVAPLSVTFPSGVATFALATDANFTVNGSSQLALASIASGRLLANCTGSTATPGGCTWSAFADVAVGNTNGLLPYRTGGAWSSISTGTSGTTIPLNNTANVFSVQQTFTLNSIGALPTAVADTVVRVLGANGATGRVTAEGYGAVGSFTVTRANNTATSPTQVLSGDQIGAFSAQAWGSNAAWNGPIASVRMYAAENITATAWGSKLCLAASALTTTTLTDGLCQNGLGGVTIGTATGGDQGAGTLNIQAGLYQNGVVATTTINGQTCPLFGSCSITATAGTIQVGVTTVTSGVAGRVLFDNAGVLGEYSITGTAGSVVMSASPTLTGIPVLGAPTATSLALGGATIGGNALAVTGTTLLGGALNYGGVTLSNSVTGTGSMVLSASPTLTGTLTAAAATFSGTANFAGAFQISGVGQTFPGSGLIVGTTDIQTLTNKTLTSPTMTNPVLGVATGTSLALGGCTIGANAFCATGSAAISSTLTSAAHAITSASANALVVGVNGSTNPAFNVDASTASSATGVNIKSAAAAGGVAISVISSGTNENLTLDAKGSGTITVGSTSTGSITLTRATTMSAALTYGGVTLSNSVTGTGSMALSASPTFTGTLTAGGANFGNPVGVLTGSAAAFFVTRTGNLSDAAFVVDSSVASNVAGVKITGAVTGGTVAISAIDTGSNTNLSIDAKGSGTVTINGTATGGITLSRATTMSAALTYGGVTLSNSVTGTGSMVLSAAPTITGNVTLQGVTSTGATGTGNIVFATNPSIANLTVTSAFTAAGLVTYAALNSAAIATTANYLAGASSVIVPASVIYTAETTTTYGATTTFDFDTFINTAVTLTGNITTQTLSNVKAGKAGSITFIQDGTGSRTTVWNSVFKFASGTTPTLSTAASSVDILFYSCRSATNCPASLVKDVR